MCNSEFKQISDSNFKKVFNSVSKIGYVDGVTAGKDSVFQSAFDQGYADGLKTGFEIAKWRALINANTEENTQIQNENIPVSATNKCHFQLPVNTDKPVSEISKIQNQYVDNLVQQLKIKFPNVKDNTLYFEK